ESGRRIPTGYPAAFGANRRIEEAVPVRQRRGTGEDVDEGGAGGRAVERRGFDGRDFGGPHFGGLGREKCRDERLRRLIARYLEVAWRVLGRAGEAMGVRGTFEELEERRIEIVRYIRGGG
ncbi:unnamed protein product, partial [Laminaria digitata]